MIIHFPESQKELEAQDKCFKTLMSCNSENQLWITYDWIQKSHLVPKAFKKVLFELCLSIKDIKELN